MDQRIEQNRQAYRRRHSNTEKKAANVMKQRIALIVFLGIVSELMVSCGGGGGGGGSSTPPAPNPVPTISGISPPFVTAGGGETVLTINGTGFVQSSIASLDGTSLPTSFTSASAVKATLSAAMVASAQIHLVTVSNPSPGGGSSANVGPWVLTGNMTTARANHTQTLLLNGKVLVAGGGWVSGLLHNILGSAELYDPASRTFSATGSMSIPRNTFAATLLVNGKVLIAGGVRYSSSNSPSASTPQL